MPFAPKYAAQFIGLILTNVQAVLERDVPMALAEIDPELQAFKDFNFPTPLTTVLPSLYLDPVRSKISQSDDDSHLIEQHELVILLAIGGPDPRKVRDWTMQYIRAVDQVLRTMSVQDLIGGVTDKRSGLAWEVTDHDHGITTKVETIYRRDASLTFVVQLMER